MKKTFKRILSAIALTALVVTTFSSCANSTFNKAPQYKENDDGTVSFYRYTSVSTETSFTIPDTHNGKDVTGMLDFSVANAEYLQELNIGKNVKTIDERALNNCVNLKAINVSEENPYFKSVDGVLYNKDMTELIAYPNGKSPIENDSKGNYIKGGEYTVPDTVKEIRPFAFYMCSNLHKINLNEGLEKVGKMAFIKCVNLSELKLPSTLVEIGVDAFSYCDALKVIEIPSSVKTIGDYAFYSSASNVTKVIVHQESEKDITLGKDWLPNQKNGINKEVPVEYVGRDK